MDPSMNRNDRILIVAALLVALLGFAWISLRQSEGGNAVVLVDGEEYASYPLGQDGEYRIETDRGSNLLVIKNGAADMTEADCPDKLCVKQKAVDKDGETIVCLPHRVVVEIQAEEETELDGVTR